MIKLYLYPDAPPLMHGFESGGAFSDCFPFCKTGIERWCDIVDDPKRAQLFFGGSYHDNFRWLLHPGRFEHLTTESAARHVFDREGDWPNLPVPEWLGACTFSTVNVPEVEKDRFPLSMARPTFSRLFVQLARYEAEEFRPPVGKSFGFRGQRDPFGFREKVRAAFEASIAGGEYSYTESWNGPTPAQSTIVADFRKLILGHAFSICPAGAGQTTARFFETCYFGRVPVVINDMRLFGGEGYDMSFAVHIPISAREEDITAVFDELAEMPESEILDRCKAAKAYFDGPVREYIKDPTLYFLKFMKKRGLIDAAREEI